MLFREKSRKSKTVILKKMQTDICTTGKELGSPKETRIPLTRSRKFETGRASLNASLTVEAALVLPVFLYMAIVLIQVVVLMGQAGALEGRIADTAKQMAVSAYAVRNNSSGRGLQGGISAAYARSRLSEYVKKQKNFHLGYSSFLKDEDEIDLVAAYRTGSGVPLFSFGNPEIIQRGCVRAWTGRDFRDEMGKGGKGTEKEQVYVTDNREVYHKSLKCTHLRLSIRQIPMSAASGLRNRYGEKYYACSCCRSGTGSVVYITDMGNRYHASLSCSGLKRTIHRVPASEAGDLPPCSKCGG